MNYSFIIPVFNCAAYLPSCIQSILAADIPSSEILLIDDGSTDGTGALCDALSRKHSTIRVLHQENSGVSAARNAGLAAASGKHIIFVDGDDTLDASALREILSDPCILEMDLSIFGMTFDYYRRGVCYRQEPCCLPSEGIFSASQWGSIFVELFRCNALSPVWNKVYNREIILANHLQLNTDLFLYEDLDFVLRYMACCENIRLISKMVYHYRQAEDEGNPRRRLKRIPSIPAYLKPIEISFRLLAQQNAEVSSSLEEILQLLYLILAREKISGSRIREIGRICKDYAAWEATLITKPQGSHFRDQLVNKRVFRLWVTQKLGALRHKVAVVSKSSFHRRKE